jgi:hypothetical protein
MLLAILKQYESRIQPSALYRIHWQHYFTLYTVKTDNLRISQPGISFSQTCGILQT